MATQGLQELSTVSRVDLFSYAGMWFEIASIPRWFQKRGFCATVTYSLTGNGYLQLKNCCHNGSLDGSVSSVTAKVFVEADSKNTKFKVQFFWPFRMKYWVIDLAGDYSYAVLGRPNRAAVWILSRTPQMDVAVYNLIIAKLQLLGFNTNKIALTRQIIPTQYVVASARITAA